MLFYVIMWWSLRDGPFGADSVYVTAVDKKTESRGWRFQWPYPGEDREVDHRNKCIDEHVYLYRLRLNPSDDVPASVGIASLLMIVLFPVSDQQAIFGSAK
jgi:hypothetical protein